MRAEDGQESSSGDVVCRNRRHGLLLRTWAFSYLLQDLGISQSMSLAHLATAVPNCRAAEPFAEFPSTLESRSPTF
jgi:hypothetical protein